MKAKKITALLALLALTVSLFSLFSCGKVAEAGKVTVVIETAEGKYEAYEAELEGVENKEKGAVAILEALSSRKDRPLALEMTDGAYGKMILSIGGLVPDATKNEFIAIYTSREADFDVSEYAKSIEYNGRTLTTSGLGISSMSAEDGTVILFRIETWQ